MYGRFTSRDPSREAGGWNLYSYAYGNPFVFKDPSGLAAEDAQARDRTVPGLYSNRNDSWFASDSASAVFKDYIVENLNWMRGTDGATLAETRLESFTNADIKQVLRAIADDASFWSQDGLSSRQLSQQAAFKEWVGTGLRGVTMAERALADAKDLVKWNGANLLKAMDLIDAPRLQLQAGMERLGFSPAAAAATGYALEFVFTGGIKTVGSAAVRSGVKATVKTAAKKGSGFAAGGAARAVPSALRGGEATTHAYFGVRNGERVYVGSTNDIARRQAEHGGRFVLERITQSPVTRGEARAIEQALINRNPGFENIRNSISPNHSWYGEAVEWGEAWLRAAGY